MSATTCRHECFSYLWLLPDLEEVLIYKKNVKATNEYLLETCAWCLLLHFLYEWIITIMNCMTAFSEHVIHLLEFLLLLWRSYIVLYLSIVVFHNFTIVPWLHKLTLKRLLLKLQMCFKWHFPMRRKILKSSDFASLTFLWWKVLSCLFAYWWLFDWGWDVWPLSLPLYNNYRKSKKVI